MRPIKKGSTDQSVVIRIVDSSDGTPETGVEHNTSGIDLWYRREGATKTSITEASLASLDAAHSDGGIEHIGDGYYRLDLPDAAFAGGANGVMIGGTVTGMIVVGCYVPLVDYDPYDGVRAGLTALPNAAADAAGGLPISDAGGLDLDTLLSRLTANVATEAKQDIIDTVVDAIKAKTDNLPADPADDSDIDTQLAAITAYVDKIDDATVGLTALKALIDTIDTVVDAIKAVTDNLPDSGALTTINNNLNSVLTDTNELQAELADGGRTDLILDELTTQGDTNQSKIDTALTNLGTPANIDGGGATVADNLKKIADDNGGADFDATNHSLKAIRTQGDAAWVTDIGGSCQHTYTVLDDDQNPIPEVRVEAWANDVHFQTQYTDTNGQAVFWLDAGTYDFICRKFGYSFTNPDSETVS